MQYVFVFCILWLSIFSHTEENTYRFTINGKEYSPETFALQSDTLSEGDLVRIDEVFLTIGVAKTYDFITSQEDKGKIFLRQEKEKVLVGVNVSWTYEKSEKVYFNPLKELTAEEIGNLWGINVGFWNDSLEKLLADVGRKTCVVIDNADKNKALPPLPNHIEYLYVRENSNRGITDYSSLQNYAQLKFFKLDGYSGAEFDANWFSSSLRYLDVGGQAISNIDSLSKLQYLRYLDLAGCGGVNNIDFVNKVSQLRHLNIQRTTVEDLSPLGSLQNLSWVNANGCPVGKLPQKNLPKLATLKVMFSKLSQQNVDAFAQLNPQTQVFFNWNRLLQRTMHNATLLKVRSGGTCHRDVSSEKVLFEEKDVAKIHSFLSQIQVVENRSGDHCMCCGNPTFEFYNGDKLIGMLGFHHGQSIRWPGYWPGDGILTSESADFLCKWLFDCGIKAPWQERQRIKKQQEVAKRQAQFFQKLIPQQTMQKLRKARSNEDVISAFEESIPDEVKRAELSFKLHGSGLNYSWNMMTSAEHLSGKLLENIRADNALQALKKAMGDPYVVSGAARWIFGSDRTKDYTTLKIGKELFDKLANYALAHPREINRRRTMYRLFQYADKHSVLLLEKMLHKKITPRPISEDDIDPGGMVVYTREDAVVTEKCSDAVFAAFMLAKMEKMEYLETIQQLDKVASEGEKKVLQEAISLLTADKSSATEQQDK